MPRSDYMACIQKELDWGSIRSGILILAKRYSQFSKCSRILELCGAGDFDGTGGSGSSGNTHDDNNVNNGNNDFNLYLNLIPIREVRFEIQKLV